MRKRAFTLVELLVVIAIIALLMGLLMPALARTRQLAYRMTCGTNLSGIGKAMLLYAHEYNGKLPKAGGLSNDWMDKIPDWQAPHPNLAYGQESKRAKGQVSVSSHFYMLVKYMEVTPKSFNCRGQQDVRPFEISAATGVKPDLELHQAWDFGPVIDGDENPSRFNSYAYHAPFGKYALSTQREPTLAIAGDRNPWLVEGREMQEGKGWMDFIPDEGKPFQSQGVTNESALVGNSDAHGGRGSNIAFLDGHVSFEKRAWVGVEQDNVYTYATGIQEDYKGRPPLLYDYQDDYLKDKRDTCLMQDGGGNCEGGVCVIQ